MRGEPQMKVRDLFDLAYTIVSKLDYMTDNYEEYDESLDDIPNKTLDDIIDEINRENEVDDNEEATEETGDDDTGENSGSDNNTDNDSESDNSDGSSDNSGDGDVDENSETEQSSPMDEWIDKCNIIISILNADKRNAEMDGVLDCDVTDTRKSVIRTCRNITCNLTQLYDALYHVVDIFNSDDNINKRSRFVIDSYNALVKFTELVNAIYDALNERAYLVQVNGPITSDIEHWNNEEVQDHLITLTDWQNTDDDKKLSLMDEAVQFALKYAALLKKLVISEFKGFDEYYNELMEFLCAMNKAANNYEPENAFVNIDDPDNIFYDPTILGKVSAITMVTEGYIPWDPDEHPDEDGE